MNRLSWPDIAKGISIFLVVVLHTGEGVFTAGIGVRGEPWAHFHDLCYTFMVPVFFLLAGLFSQMSSKNPLARLKTLGANIIYPYVLWSIVQMTLMVLTKAGNNVPEWSNLPVYLMNGWMQFWFLHTLAIIFIVDILFRFLGVPCKSRICIAFLISSLVILGVDFPWMFNLVAEHLIYFEVGVLLALTPAPVKQSLSLLTCIVVAAVCTFTFYCTGASYGNSLRMVGAFSGIALCIAVSVALSPYSLPNKVLSLLGRFSLQIYVLHIIFAAGFRVFLIKCGVDSFRWHLILGSLVGIISPLLLAFIDQKYELPFFRFRGWSHLLQRRTQHT